MNRPTTGYTEKGNGRSALFAAAKAALLCEKWAKCKTKQNSIPFSPAHIGVQSGQYRRNFIAYAVRIPYGY